MDDLIRETMPKMKNFRFRNEALPKSLTDEELDELTDEGCKTKWNTSREQNPVQWQKLRSLLRLVKSLSQDYRRHSFTEKELKELVLLQIPLSNAEKSENAGISLTASEVEAIENRVESRKIRLKSYKLMLKRNGLYSVSDEDSEDDNVDESSLPDAITIDPETVDSGIDESMDEDMMDAYKIDPTGLIATMRRRRKKRIRQLANTYVFC